MNSRTITMSIVIAAVAAVGFAGCYTKLMPFREAVAVRKSSVAQAQNSGPSGGSDVDYRNNCLSCHTQAELNDRAFDMDYAGLYSVHGIAYDPYGWQNPYTQPPWWNPFPVVTVETTDGGLIPVISTGGGSGSSAARPAEKGNRTRTNSGSARESDRTRASSPASATSSPSGSTSSGNYGSSSSSGSVPTVSSPPQQTQSTPPSQPTETRSNSGGSQETHTRRSGSGRE